jgi:hypothetical protein
MSPRSWSRPPTRSGSTTFGHDPGGDDCNGALLVDLDEPVGDRAVVVEGNPWVPYEGTCGRRVTLVPPDIPGWFTDCG